MVDLDREIFVCRLNKQRELLSEVVREFETKSHLDLHDIEYAAEVLKEVELI